MRPGKAGSAAFSVQGIAGVADLNSRNRKG
jgi:hypothetical protein